MLEAFLNTHYSREMTEKPVAIHVRENPASPTGFEMEYITERDGIRRDVIVPLVNEEIEMLQDTAKGGLIRSGVIVRLMPPFLMVRRRLSDGRETPVPELMDIEYRSASAAMIQHMLNHPAIVRGPGEGEVKARFVEIRVVKHPNDKTLLWLECYLADALKPLLRALTHQNMANLQHDEMFLEHLHVNTSMDNRKIGILDSRTKIEQSLVVDVHSPEEVLAAAGRVLTASLRVATGACRPVSDPVPPPPAEPPLPLHLESKTPPAQPPSRVIIPAPEPPAPEPEPEAELGIPPEIEELFSEKDPIRINESIFEELAADVDLPVMDVCFSLARVFNHRRFRILNFDDTEVRDVMDLRGEDFYGFYLAELPHQGLDLVYACRGVHIEWGLDKCVVQTGFRTEPMDYRGHGLLGLAQDRDSGFLFIVEPEYKAWVRPHQSACAQANAKFATLREFAGMRHECTPIWPVEVVAEGV